MSHNFDSQTSYKLEQPDQTQAWGLLCCDKDGWKRNVPGAWRAGWDVFRTEPQRMDCNGLDVSRKDSALVEGCETQNCQLEGEKEGWREDLWMQKGDMWLVGVKEWGPDGRAKWKKTHLLWRPLREEQERRTGRLDEKSKTSPRALIRALFLNQYNRSRHTSLF